MTTAQYSRLLDIIKDIESAKRHPSPHVQAAWARHTEGEWEHVVHQIEKALHSDDGYKAYRIIKAWHDGDISTVAALMLPIDNKSSDLPF